MIPRGGRQKWIGLAVLAVTFLAGGVAGAAIAHVAARETAVAPAQRSTQGREGERRGRRFPYEELGVTAEQRTQIEAVFERRREDMAAVWHEYEPRMDAIVDSTRAELNRILTPEQREKYEEYRRKRREQSRSSESSDRDRGSKP